MTGCKQKFTSDFSIQEHLGKEHNKFVRILFLILRSLFLDHEEHSDYSSSLEPGIVVSVIVIAVVLLITVSLLSLVF